MTYLPKIKIYEDFEKLKPTYDWMPAAKAILLKHSLPFDSLTLFPDGSNLVFAFGTHRVIKVFPPVLRDQFESERLVLPFLYGKLSILTPQLEFEGEVD